LAVILFFGTWSASTAAGLMIRTDAQGTWAGVTIADQDGPATSGSLTSLVTPLDAQAIAFQDASGSAATSVAGSANAGRNSLTATSVWTEVLTNTTSGSVLYEAQISIPEIQLYFSGSGLQTSETERRQAAYVIRVEANDVKVFESAAVLELGAEGHVLGKQGTDLGGILDAAEVRYLFAPFTTRITLGTVASGESLEVLYGVQTAIASILSEGYVGEAFAGDPTGSAHTSIEIISTPLPEPGLGTLLLTSLGIAVAARRWRQAGVETAAESSPFTSSRTP
jgi:hypothetical protein